MTTSKGSPSHPSVSAGALVTLAFIKARIDEGADQLNSFMPLVLDVLSGMNTRYFSVADVQGALSDHHGLVMPRETVATLLGRAARSGTLVRDAGRYQISPGRNLPDGRVGAEKDRLGLGQQSLGEGLRAFLASRGLSVQSSNDSLDLLLQFLLAQQVTVILGVPPAAESREIPRVTQVAIAEYLQNVVDRDPALKGVLASILEGLVLYHATFLPDLADVARRFSGLTVAFDTVLVRQALGYEGSAPRALLRETIELLVASGVRCVVFDKTVREIQRILRFYQDRLGTSDGRKNLRPGSMARHFLTQRYSPSDVQEMAALLEQEIRDAGLAIVQTPPHEAPLTADEAKLAARLADPKTKDVAEPRVEHDVDCVAAILTMRRGNRSDRIENARAVFATVSPLVIRNTRRWWEEDEGETGVPPIVHMRALANLAWLKRPSANPDFQLRDLVTLCAAAMRPSARTWARFLTHLERLHQTQRLTEDQVTAIIVSSLSDRMLREVEVDANDPGDVDAGTLDEVVDRVIADYSASADIRIRDAEQRARGATDRLRRRELLIDGRARRIARVIGLAAYLSLIAILLAASAVLLLRDVFAGDAIVAVALLVVTALQITGTWSQFRSVRLRVESWMYRRFRTILGADELASETAMD
jgi:hypothetical protein